MVVVGSVISGGDGGAMVADVERSPNVDGLLVASLNGPEVNSPVSSVIADVSIWPIVVGVGGATVVTLGAIELNGVSSADGTPSSRAGASVFWIGSVTGASAEVVSPFGLPASVPADSLGCSVVILSLKTSGSKGLLVNASPGNLETGSSGFVV